VKKKEKRGKVLHVSMERKEKGENPEGKVKKSMKNAEEEK